MCQSVPGTLPSGTVTVSVTVQYLTSSLLNPRQLTWPIYYCKLPDSALPLPHLPILPWLVHASTLLVNMATDSLHPNPFVQGHSGVHAGSPSSLPSPVEGIQVITTIQYLPYLQYHYTPYLLYSICLIARARSYPSSSLETLRFFQPTAH